MLIQTQFDVKTNTLTIPLPAKFDESIFDEFKACFELKDTLVKPSLYQVDFNQTEEVDSTGLLLILALFYYARDRGAKVVLFNTKPQVKQFLIENQYNEIVELN